MTDDEARENIAANVERLRGERSRYWLANEAKTVPIAITRIERGNSAPGAGLLARLAEALGVTTDDLLKPPPTTKKTGKKRDKQKSA